MVHHNLLKIKLIMYRYMHVHNVHAHSTLWQRGSCASNFSRQRREKCKDTMAKRAKHAPQRICSHVAGLIILRIYTHTRPPDLDQNLLMWAKTAKVIRAMQTYAWNAKIKTLMLISAHLEYKVMVKCIKILKIPRKRLLFIAYCRRRHFQFGVI